MRYLLAIIRLLICGGILIFFIGRLLILSLFSGHNERRAMLHRRQFIRVILPVLGIRVHVQGRLPEDTGAALFVSNHRSYLDPVVVLHDALAHPVAKAEVASWPLISQGVRLTGIIFVQRDEQGSRVAARKAIEQNLLAGKSIFICPEGTTHIYKKTVEFHKAAFYLAAAHDVPVYPTAVEYGEPDAAFIGKDKFLPHFMKLFGHWKIPIYVSFGPPLKNSDGGKLLQATQNWIDQAGLELQAKYGLDWLEDRPTD